MILPLFISALALSDQENKVSDDTCPKYLCKLSTQLFDTDDCDVYDGTDHFLRVCNNGYQCTTSGTTNQTCTWEQNPYPDTKFAYVGEPCTYNIDCQFGTCAYSSERGKDICIGLSEGEQCNGFQERCNPGLFCNSTNYCYPQYSIGDTGCSGDFQCENGAGCNNTASGTGNCVAYMSIAAGQPLAFCDSTNLKKSICESQQCWDKGAEGYICASAIVTNSTTSLPKTCTESSQCASNSDPIYSEGSILTQCECGYSGVNSDKYCGLHSGDPVGVEYAKYLKMWYQSTQISYCNTERRDEEICISTYWDFENATKLIYWKKYFDNYINIQENDECVKSLYTSDFWVYEKAFKDLEAKDVPDPEIVSKDDSDDFALVLSAIAAFYF